MSDPVWPLAPGEPRTLVSVNGFGTLLLHNSRPDADGRFFATRWFMIILPVVPLGRYHVRRLGVRQHGGFFSSAETTRYEVFGRSRLRAIEIIRTYLYFWLVLPAVFLGPIGASIALDDDPSGEGAELVGMLVAVALFWLALWALHLYRTRLRPVREAVPAVRDTERG